MITSRFLPHVGWDLFQTPQFQVVSLCVNGYQSPESDCGPHRVYSILPTFDVKTYIRHRVGVGKDLAAGMSGSKQPKDSVQNAAVNDTSIFVRN